MTLKKQIVSKDVYTLGLERVRFIYSQYDKVVVSFSGGKDSTVALNLTLIVAKELKRLPVECVFWDEEAIHPETIEYVERISKDPRVNLRWYCLPIKHLNACSKTQTTWHPWAIEDKHKWCRSLPKKAITKLPGFARQAIPECNAFLFPQSDGETALITGIRASESLRRYRIVTHRVYQNYISRDTRAPHVAITKPIFDWTTEDVWTAPRRYGWDYNRAYDIMTKAGIAPNMQRVCPPFGAEPLGSLWQYAQNWPQLWEKMINRVPGAATAGRYSRSPLYGFNSLNFDTDVDPKKQIKKALEKWPAEQRRLVASRIREEIINHGTKSKEPIPMTVPGYSGVTWKYLYMLAVRGDFKKRRQPNYKPGLKDEHNS